MLGEYEISPTLIEEKIWERRDEFLNMNPAVTLPVYVEEDGVPVVGGPVIAEYLDETVGAMKRDRRLFPEQAFARAEMRRICDWILTKMEAEVTKYTVHERVYKRLMSAAHGGGAPDSKALRAARTNIKYHLQYLGWLAGTRSWLAGERMTYADLCASAALSVLDYLGEIDWNESPYLKDWYARMKSRPSFRPLLGDRVRGMPPVSHYVDLDF